MLTTDEEIHQMNKEHRGIDRPTDVLLFRWLNTKEAGQFDFLEDQYDCFHPETGELLLGDIGISVKTELSLRQKSTDMK